MHNNTILRSLELLHLQYFFSTIALLKDDLMTSSYLLLQGSDGNQGLYMLKWTDELRMIRQQQKDWIWTGSLNYPKKLKTPPLMGTQTLEKFANGRVLGHSQPGSKIANQSAYLDPPDSFAVRSGKDNWYKFSATPPGYSLRNRRKTTEVLRALPQSAKPSRKKLDQLTPWHRHGGSLRAVGWFLVLNASRNVSKERLPKQSNSSCIWCSQ